MIRLATFVLLAILNRQQPLPYANFCCVVLLPQSLTEHDGWRQVSESCAEHVQFQLTHICLLAKVLPASVQVLHDLNFTSSSLPTRMVLLYQMVMRFHSDGIEGRSCCEFNHIGICPFLVSDSDSHHISTASFLQLNKGKYKMQALVPQRSGGR